MKLLPQLNPRPRGFWDGSYYKMRDLSTTLKMTDYSHSERSDNEVEESSKQHKSRAISA